MKLGMQPKQELLFEKGVHDVPHASSKVPSRTYMDIFFVMIQKANRIGFIEGHRLGSM